MHAIPGPQLLRKPWVFILEKLLEDFFHGQPGVRWDELCRIDGPVEA